MQYIMKLIMAVVSRLKTLTLNPVRNFFRKIQMMVNINVIANKILKPVTKKFRDLFHIKPQSEDDYYSVGRFLVARKLVAAAIVVCCIAVFAYFSFIAEPVEQPVTTMTGIVSNVYFDYDDIALTEYTGKANIRAANGGVVYTGDIKEGVCDGTGTLYNQSGVLVYEGKFTDNAYNGHGKGYAADGSLQYEGEYVGNVYEGEGTLYYPSGAVKYKGSFSGGFYSGNGFLYTEKGELIYEGAFQNGLYHGTGVLYYEDGDRRYEGDFVMGTPQGTGTLYTGAGRPYYTGIVANGDIAYESLITLSLQEIEEMFYEDPEIYYTQDSACYVYETAQLSLELDCIVKILTNDLLDDSNVSGEGDGWYLPESAGDAVELDTQQEEESADDKPTDFITQEQAIYYYVNNSEWVLEADLDKGSVKVEGVTVYKDLIASPFEKDKEFVAVNGVIGLSDCIAIQNIRQRTPTAFSNITFEAASSNYRYTYVKNINYAQAIYEELIDTEEFSYQLCYQTDDVGKLCYYKVTGIQ